MTYISSDLGEIIASRNRGTCLLYNLFMYVSNRPSIMCSVCLSTFIMVHNGAKSERFGAVWRIRVLHSFVRNVRSLTVCLHLLCYYGFNCSLTALQKVTPNALTLRCKGFGRYLSNLSHHKWQAVTSATIIFLFVVHIHTWMLPYPVHIWLTR